MRGCVALGHGNRVLNFLLQNVGSCELLPTLREETMVRSP
jgi:hypothetical protein